LPKTKKKSPVNEDKVLYTKEELFERITLCLSGRVAEEHYLGKTSTLSADDLKIATRLAEKMMKNLGMSKMGNITSKNIGEKNLSVS
jgi:cell division protease FtsH